MKTHIIIPIADIENEINANREYLNSLQRNERSNDSDKLEQKTEFLEDLLSTYKQISLEEKDIEEKANQYAGNGNWELFEDDNFNIRKEAFKKALNELL